LSQNKQVRLEHPGVRVIEESSGVERRQNGSNEALCQNQQFQTVTICDCEGEIFRYLNCPYLQIR